MFVSHRLYLAMIMGLSLYECATLTRVNMVSDLIDMIGKMDGTLCDDDNNNNNMTSSRDLLDEELRPLLLSQYTFVRTSTSSCDEFPLSGDSLRDFNWACFTAGSSLSRDINWMFVDCARSNMASIKCLERSKVDEIFAIVCGEDEIRCMNFTTVENEEHVCSNRFEIRSVVIERKESDYSEKSVFPSRMDTIAIGCALFILVTFIVSMCISEEKCKPSYSYDEDVGLRVPLEIYELYGQHYKPSERRKAKSAFTQALGSISIEAPQSVRLKNVTVVANADSNPSPYGRYTTKPVGPPTTVVKTETNGCNHENAVIDRSEHQEVPVCVKQGFHSKAYYQDITTDFSVSNEGFVMDTVDKFANDSDGTCETGIITEFQGGQRNTDDDSVNMGNSTVSRTNTTVEVNIPDEQVQSQSDVDQTHFDVPAQKAEKAQGDGTMKCSHQSDVNRIHFDVSERKSEKAQGGGGTKKCSHQSNVDQTHCGLPESRVKKAHAEKKCFHQTGQTHQFESSTTTNASTNQGEHQKDTKDTVGTTNTVECIHHKHNYDKDQGTKRAKCPHHKRHTVNYKGRAAAKCKRQHGKCRGTDGEICPHKITRVDTEPVDSPYPRQEGHNYRVTRRSSFC